MMESRRSLPALWPLLLFLAVGTASCQTTPSAPSETATEGVMTTFTQTAASSATITAIPSPSPSATPIPRVETISYTDAVGDLLANFSRITILTTDFQNAFVPAILEPFISYEERGMHLSWSPDGRYLAFEGEIIPYDGTVSPRATCGLRLADFETQQLDDISTEGLVYHADNGPPSWSPDSKRLVVTLRDDTQSDSHPTSRSTDASIWVGSRWLIEVSVDLDLEP